jgi:hypothetical protein
LRHPRFLKCLTDFIESFTNYFLLCSRVLSYPFLMPVCNVSLAVTTKPEGEQRFRSRVIWKAHSMFPSSATTQIYRKLHYVHLSCWYHWQ